MPIIIGGMGGRERLLRAAGENFGVRAYHEVSVAPIIALAEVQAPTLYHHFGDKEGLFVEWAKEALLGLSKSLRLPQSSSIFDRLAAFATAYFNSVDFDLRLVVRDIRSLERAESQEMVFGAYFQAVYEPLCAILLAGMDAGMLPMEPVSSMADTFLATLDSHASSAQKDPASTATLLTDRFLNGHSQR